MTIQTAIQFPYIQNPPFISFQDSLPKFFFSSPELKFLLKISLGSIVLYCIDMAGIYGGTTQKCRACEKTVYLVDQLTADNRVYHRACFRCHHCKSTLKLFNYNSFEGVLYCKPHYDQLYKMTGSLNKSFDAAPRAPRTEKDQAYTNTRFSSMFGGTQDKCVACKKTVYPIEKVTVDGTSYHKPCFRCAHGGCVISPSNYVAHEQHIYCRHHHTQLFKQKGNFSQLGKKENGNGTVEVVGKLTQNGNTTENGSVAA